MSTPLSPGPATTTGLDELPAYLSNGLIGLRALDIPDTPPSRSFFANLGGFLSGLLYGLPGIRLGADEPSTWPSRPVVLPAGWRSIEVERAWVRAKPARIVATHGAERALIDMPHARRRRAA